MGFLRSEDMHLYKILFSKDEAAASLNRLGKLSAAHLLDANKDEQAFKLPYSEMIKRCEESQRRLAYCPH